MTSTPAPLAPSASTRTPRRSSRTWATLCAETLAGIADPLFPALTLAESSAPADAARALLAGLLDPVDTPTTGEALPAWLLPHQADAVRRSRAILRRFGGVLVADGVGLGKTYIALALAARERAERGDAVAIVPAALRPEWVRAVTATRVPIELHTHSELARRRPAFAPGTSLLLVDEAHGFRNPATRRYRALADLAVGRRVALFTATPFNNAPADLAALVHLFAGRDRFREFGVDDLVTALRRGHGAASLALAAISVCRSRRLVQACFPNLRAAFPVRRLVPAAEYDLDAAYGGALQPLLHALSRLAEGWTETERGAALFHLGLLRRLESSRAALRRSLLRHRDFLTECAAAAKSGRRLSQREFRALFPRHDEDDTQLTLLPLLLAEVTAATPDDLADRRRWIDRALELVDAAASRPDPKLQRLEALLATELAGRRTIVFTEYRDTALHLARQLRRRARVLAVTGDSAWVGRDPLPRGQALDAFAPISRGARANPLLRADVLVATDVASEGMNLQDASAVVCYDLPWNPVRVMQRIGRVDRLGSLDREVVLAHLVPAGGLRLLTGVLHTLRVKLGAARGTLNSEPDPLAALWWLDHPLPLADAVEAQSWRCVEPFEAGERWRMVLAPQPQPRPQRPLVAAGIVSDGGEPEAGLLLALEWRNGSRVPLPFVARQGTIVLDGFALGELALRALRASPLPSSPSDFACLLASALPEARAQLLAISATRRGAGGAAPGRDHAIRALVHAGHRAEAARDHAASALIGRALSALVHELPAGLDRRLLQLASREAPGAQLAARILECIPPALPPAGDPLDGTPRLVLVGAIALATRCPSA
jgi:superfamily II DNA or RNA helicase